MKRAYERYDTPVQMYFVVVIREEVLPKVGHFDDGRREVNGVKSPQIKKIARLAIVLYYRLIQLVFDFV